MHEVQIKGDLAGAGVLVKATPDGLIKAARASVVLDAAHKHTYQVPGAKDEAPATAITAEGYYWINRVAGLQVVTPPTVWIDGGEQRNPYIQRDAAGNVLAVVVRKIAIGRAPLGNLVATDATLAFSPKLYLIRDLLKAARYNKNLATLKPTSLVTDEERKTRWLIDLGLGLTLCVNTGDDEFAKKLSNHQEVVLFAERRAQTIAERMALARHPAIAQKTVIPDQAGKVRVDIIAWAETDESREDLMKKTLALSRGEAPKDLVIDPSYDTDDEPHTVQTQSAASEPPPATGQPQIGPATGQEAPPAADAPRRGRPPGSKNKPKPTEAGGPGVEEGVLSPAGMDDATRARFVECIEAAGDLIEASVYGELLAKAGIRDGVALSQLPDASLLQLRAACDVAIEGGVT